LEGLREATSSSYGLLQQRISGDTGGRLLLRPKAAAAALLDFFGHRVGFDEPGRLLEKVEELGEILAEDEQARLADLAGGVVALALGEHEEVVAVVGLLHLRGVRARADGLEELLEENLLLRGTLRVTAVLAVRSPVGCRVRLRGDTLRGRWRRWKRRRGCRGRWIGWARGCGGAN